MASSKTDHPALIKTPHAAMVPCPRRPRFLREWEENKKKTKSYRLKYRRRSGIRRSLTARWGLAGGLRDEDMQL